MGTPTTPNQDEFQVSDLGIGAWLLTHGLPLLAVRSDGRRAIFIFPSTARALAQRYFETNGDAALVRRFHACLRDLRGAARQATT